MPTQEEIPLVHVYGQSEPHDEVWILANREGLLRAQRAIQKALDEGYGEEDAFVSGEEGGFSLQVLRLDEPSQSDFWRQLAAPYRGTSWAEDTRPDALWPIHIAPTQEIPGGDPEQS